MKNPTKCLKDTAIQLEYRHRIKTLGDLFVQVACLRPDVEGLIVDGEDTEYSLFQGPFCSVVVQNELIVLEITWERLEVYKLTVA